MIDFLLAPENTRVANQWSNVKTKCSRELNEVADGDVQTMGAICDKVMEALGGQGSQPIRLFGRTTVGRNFRTIFYEVADGADQAKQRFDLLKSFVAKQDYTSETWRACIGALQEHFKPEAVAQLK